MYSVHIVMGQGILYALAEKGEGMNKPVSEYTIKARIYEQEDIAKALGITVGKHDVLCIYADGHNKVHVELYRFPLRKGKG